MDTDKKVETMDTTNTTTVEEVTKDKKKLVVIALPGNSYSGTFLMSWTKTIDALRNNNYEVVVLNRYSSFVGFSRMMTLGLDVTRGADQKPFGEQLDYDVWLTIDSDIIFNHEQVIELINNTDVHPVVSGMYMMSDLKHFPCITEWDENYFATNGTFKFSTPEDIENYKNETKQKFMPVVYNGMGFFACRKGVIESMKYPYFWDELQTIKGNDTNMVDMCSEDVAFCRNLGKAGYDIYVNTDLRVGHEKKLII